MILKQNEDLIFQIEDYKIVKLIGTGFNSTFLVKNIHNGQEYAAKEYRSFDKTIKSQNDIKHELYMIKKLNHPSLLKIIGLSYDSLLISGSFSLTLLFEYCKNGSLRDMLEEEREGNKNFNMNGTKKYICLLGISHSVSYLHKNNIIHYQLRPENVLLDENLYPKVCDFGILNRINKISKHFMISSEMLYHMAPEILIGDKYGVEIDVYAFGIIAYEITTLARPYSELSDRITQLMLKIKIINGYRPQFPKNTNKKMNNLINRCLNKNPKERPSFDEIFDILSTDFSYSQEELDEDEVNNYIENLKEYEK